MLFAALRYESAGDVAVTVAVLSLGLFASALAYLVDLLARYGPLEVTPGSYGVPVVAAVGGWLLLDGAVTAGFLVVLVGFALLKDRRPREAGLRPA